MLEISSQRKEEDYVLNKKGRELKEMGGEQEESQGGPLRREVGNKRRGIVLKYTYEQCRGKPRELTEDATTQIRISQEHKGEGGKFKVRRTSRGIETKAKILINRISNVPQNMRGEPGEKRP
jgi:hypothetical protein